MATASENARKVLNSIKAKLNLDKFPRGTFIEGFGDDLAYIRYNGCIEGRFSSGELTDEEAEDALPERFLLVPRNQSRHLWRT